ncbi:HPP family protein [Halapricum salinum]|uniref:HPP family protein n=1 Tax=Halapricum salinum TaxID=1457250 RepID=A0A4D6HA25_9EURY|nr:HPP family protein [Halapricum salinum]QCC50769.1 HPP family protein [Halapricum salinum]
MNERLSASLSVGATSGALLVVPGAFVYLTGLPFLFPSLGPSAFVLAMSPDSATAAPRRVLGGHAIGVLAGMATYHLLADGAVATRVGGSTAALALVASGSLALVLTAVGMVATDTRHPPACATTLIVSLGLLTTPIEGVVIVLAVASLLVAHRLTQPLRPLGTRVQPGE